MIRTKQFKCGWLVTTTESGDSGYDDYDVTLHGFFDNKRDAEACLVQHLPQTITGWCKRYEHWTQEQYDEIQTFVDFTLYPNLRVYRINDDEDCFPALYDLNTIELHEPLPKLNQEQIIKLYNMMGGHFDCSRHSSSTTEMEWVACIPNGYYNKNYSRGKRNA